MMGWRSYEEVAEYLLNQFAAEFGLERIEGKQKIVGQRSNTEWEIDAKGVYADGTGFMIVECRQYKTLKQTQGKLGSLAYQILDTGAKGGIIVSAIGLQKGASKIAEAEHIVNVQLAANSTPTKFAMSFLKKIMIGTEENIRVSERISVVVERECRCCAK